MSFLKNGKKSVSALLISHLTFSHSVGQNFFCDVNVNVLDAFAKEEPNSQERAKDIFSDVPKVKRSAGRSLKEVKGSKISSRGSKGLDAGGYLYLEKCKNGKDANVKSGFVYFSSEEVENGNQADAFGKGISGKVHSTLKNAENDPLKNSESSPSENLESSFSGSSLESSKNNISSAGAKSVSKLNSKALSEGSKGADRSGYLYLEKGENEKGENVKNGFIYFSSEEVEDGAQIDASGKGTNGKVHSTLKNPGNKPLKNTKISPAKNFESSFSNSSLESNKNNISSDDAMGATELTSGVINKNTETDGPLKVSAFKNADTSRTYLLSKNVNENKKSGSIFKESKTHFTSKISSLGSASSNSETSSPIGVADSMTDEKEFIEKGRKSEKGEASSADDLISGIDTLFSNAEEKGLSKDIQVNSNKPQLDLSRADSSELTKEESEIKSKEKNKRLIPGGCASSFAGECVSEKNSGLVNSKKCDKSSKEKVTFEVVKVASSEVDKKAVSSVPPESEDSIGSLVPKDIKDSVTVEVIKNNEGTNIKRNSDTLTLDQESVGKDVVAPSDNKKAIDQNNTLVSKNTLNSNLDSKKLVDGEFFGSGTEKKEDCLPDSSKINELEKNISGVAPILHAKNKVSTDDKEEEFLKGIVEEESWWSRWRKRLMWGISAVATAVGCAYGAKKYFSKDSKGSNSMFPYF